MKEDRPTVSNHTHFICLVYPLGARVHLMQLMHPHGAWMHLIPDASTGCQCMPNSAGVPTVSQSVFVTTDAPIGYGLECKLNAR